MGIKLSKKGWIVLSTLVIIGLGFAFYFLVYVKQKESEIIAEKMRVLGQIKENIGLLISSEERVVKNQRSSLERDVTWIISSSPNLDGTRTPLDFSKDSTLEESVGIDTTSRMKVLKISFPGWTFDTANTPEGFHFKNDSATWVADKMLYKKSYADFFGKDLILREDRFESIGVVLLEKEAVTTLFTNHPSGNISFGDSTVSMLNKSMFEWNSSNDRYTVFNSFLEGQDETQIYLLGFVEQSELNKQKQEVSVFIITAAIILVTLMILGLPLLKVHVMSSTERLEAKDVFLAGTCMVVAPPVVILFFLLITTSIFADKQVEEDQLARLNEKIINDFKKELKNVIQQLSDVKKILPGSFVSGTASLKEQPFFSQFDQEPNSYFTTNTAQRDSQFKSFRYFNSIFWADRLGHIAVYLSSEKKPKSISSLSHRNYVMDLTRGRGILFEKDTIAFESIRSVTDGNYELGLGIPSDNKAFPILATSFSSVSIMDPVLEEGYGFCLFNAEGRTLFHSEIQRNLNENFLEETSEVFNPYVRSGLPYYTSIRYMGKEHYMYMQKVPGLDGYFLATFLDKTYTYSPNVIALNTTAEMQMAYLILLLLAYLPLYLNRIHSKYKILYGGFKNDDNHILNVQETSYTYYFAIWNSLTKEERHIIYDIAHDQFINTNNVDGIIDLLHKGILVYDYSLHLMNDSFTNFVLTKVDGDEALEQELESNKKGNWSTASAVVILVIISLIVFISLGNINILQDVNALLASLTAIFAVILRLGGMFVTGKTKE